MSGTVAQLEERGHAALAAGDGAAARAAFAAALEHGERGDLLVGLAEAVYLDGDYQAAADVWEGAYRAYKAEQRPLDAARIARTRAYQTYLDGDWPLTNGWLARARRLVADDPDSVEGHWLELFDALAEPDVDARERRLRAVAEAARRLGDANLECDALGVVGQLCVADGRVEEGMALLDEALTAVCAGEVGEFVVVEGAFCLMLSACELTQDVARAEQWVRSGDDVVSGRGLASVGALCRGYYGGILLAAGRYEEAEATLTEAVRGLRRGYEQARQNALVRLADVRLRQGRYEEAAQLLTGLEEHPDAAQPLAALHLARGDTALAAERLERALTTATGVTAARLLALLVDVHLTAGATDDARATAERLAGQAAREATPYLRGIASLARGRVGLASGSADAVAFLREALTGFSEARMPLELAATRLDLARAMAAEQPEVAIAEAKAALATFEQLDVAPQADAAAALLRELGAPVRVGPKGVGALTKREAEVLRLVGHGLTNPEIAERLVISRKTVEHHVSRVLLKLGVRNRAEAAALAARDPNVG